MAGKEVATEVKGTVVTGYDYGDDTHSGFEGTKITDLSIPFVNVLQPMSPEIVDNTIEGARPGDLFNSVTKEIMKQPLTIIPVYKEAAVVEWVPRNKGGGLVDRHELDSEIFKDAIAKNGGSRIPPKDADGKRIQFKSPAGNDLIETYYVYCLIVDADGKNTEGYCVLSFASTKIKVHKDWMTSMYTIKGRPPIFANRCHVSTVKEIRESGTSFNYKISPMLDTWVGSLINPNEQLDLLTEAKAFGQMIENGLARAAFETESDGEPAAADKAKPLPSDSDEIPF